MLVSLSNLSRSFVLVFVVLSLISCGESDKPPVTGKPTVSVYEITAQEVGQYLEFVARTEPFQSAEIRARVEGYLIERGFIEGGFVERDRLLFRIERNQYQASLNEMKAALQGETAGAQNAKRNLKRGEELSETGFISQADLDKLLTTSNQAAAAVRAAEASLERAQLNLDYTEIRAPFAGKIGKVNYDVGNLVGPQSNALATLIAIDPIYVNFQLEESRFLDYLEGGQDTDNSVKLTLRLPNNTVYDKTGLINFADTKIDESTGTIALRAEFPNPNGVVLPGLFVTLMAESQGKQLMVLLPQVAVQENQQGKFVLVVDEDNKVALRVVKLDRRINAMWVVESGLKENERVIIEGLQKVRPGVVVEPVVKSIDQISGTISEPSTPLNSPAG